ncbi:Protein DETOXIFICATION 16 [Bienertia sinuspersici]
MEKEKRSSTGLPFLSKQLIQEAIEETERNRCDYQFINNDENQEKVHRGKAFLREVKKQIWLAGPLILVGLLTFSLHIVSLMMVGRLGEVPLSAASVATSFAYVTGFSLLLGMASALETICGQSYGAEQYHMVGIHTQRAMVLLWSISIPISIIWFNTEMILVALGQNHEIAAEAAAYARFMIPSLFAYSLLQCLIRFFQTQNIVFPMLLTSGVTTLLHILICWLLVFKAGLGSKGAALANTISYWFNCLLLAVYVKFSFSCRTTWTDTFPKASFQGIPALLRLAIPSAIMVCLEMWSFEMIVLLSGLLPNPALETSVLSICLNTTSLVWVIPEGFSGAVSTRVSNELGAGDPETASLAVYVVLSMTVSESIVVGLILILIRNTWGYAYSSEIEVVQYLAAMMPLLALTNFVDGLTCVLSGTARGCGWQKLGAYINLGSFYLVGLPVAIILAFFMHIGGKGLWLGILSAITLQAISFFVITVKTNWTQEVKPLLSARKATERVFESKIHN